MSKWKNEWNNSNEGYKKKSSTVSKLDISNESIEIDSMFKQFDIAVESMNNLKAMSELTGKDTDSIAAKKIMAISSHYSCKRLGVNPNFSLESFNNNIALENVFHRSWEAIKKFFKTLIEKILSFFSKKKTFNQEEAFSDLAKRISETDFKPHQLIKIKPDGYDAGFSSIFYSVTDENGQFNFNNIIPNIHLSINFQISVCQLLSDVIKNFESSPDSEDLLEKYLSKFDEICEHDQYFHKRCGSGEIIYDKEQKDRLKNRLDISLSSSNNKIGRLRGCHQITAIGSKTEAEAYLAAVEKNAELYDNAAEKIKIPENYSKLLGRDEPNPSTTTKNMNVIVDLFSIMKKHDTLLTLFFEGIGAYIEASIQANKETK